MCARLVITHISRLKKQVGASYSNPLIFSVRPCPMNIILTLYYDL